MGTQHHNIIEINGKKYDAVTGTIIKNAAERPSKPQVVTHQKTGVVVDGFVRRPKGTAHSVAAHVTKKPQKSQTLMRTAVRKPAATAKPQPIATSPFQKSHIAPPRQRLEAARQTPKSTQISRFGDVQHRSSVVKKVQHLPVAQHRAKIISDTPPKPVAQHAPAHQVSRPASAVIHQALAAATAHEQPHHPAPKSRRRLSHKLGVSSRALAISSTVLAGVLLGGFFAVQNVPNLSMRVAAARAGFAAGMPGYSPSGFRFSGPISYRPGQVTISFRSNTDDRSFAITQHASNWNSDALLANYVVAEGKQYQTYLDRGRTLYIYDGSNATWVDNGIWYQIEGDSGMTTDQLVRVAASL